MSTDSAIGTGHVPGGPGYGGVDRADEIRESSRAEGSRRIDFGGMSSSEIMSFLTRIMRDVDGQLAARAHVLESRNADSARLSEEVAVLNDLIRKAGKGANENLAISGPIDPRQQMEGVGAEQYLREHGMEHLLEDLPRSPRSDGGEYVTKADLETRLEELKNAQSALSSASEMDMINFQSIVQTRQIFVNLATQMMNSQHDAQNNVVRNIG